MKILAEPQVNKTSYNPIYDIIKAKKAQVLKPISLFSKLSEKKKIIEEAKSLAFEIEKESKIAYLLLADFKISQDDSVVYKRKSENIKSFAKHEFISAKKLLEETGQISKNEKKRKKENNNTYVRVKKRKFAGGIEIDDYTNGSLTRKIKKIGDYITVTAVDLNKNVSIFSFDSAGNLLSYLDNVVSVENVQKVNERYTYTDGVVSSIDLEYQKYGDSSESSRKRFEFRNKKLIKMYKSYNQFKNQEVEAGELYLYSTKDFPYRYCKKYTLTADNEEFSELEYKYETIDYLTYLKESRKQQKTETGEDKVYVSRFRRKKLKAIYIQDVQTRHLRSFIFDLEGNPTSYHEDVLAE